MSDPIETAMLANLLEVFNERDPARRLAAIIRTYAMDVAWTDEEGTVTGHNELESKCVALQRTIGAAQFAADGPVRLVPGFGQLAWKLLDPVSGQSVMTGFDAATVDDGLITRLWTVLTGPQG